VEDNFFMVYLGEWKCGVEWQEVMFERGLVCRIRSIPAISCLSSDLCQFNSSIRGVNVFIDSLAVDMKPLSDCNDWQAIFKFQGKTFALSIGQLCLVHVPG
jgi:hypothetical protein